MADSSIETSEAPNSSPDVAARLRDRRPGYNEIAKLVARFDEIAGSKKAFDLPAEEIAHMFVRPALEALGWRVSNVEESPFRNFQNEMSPLVAEYRDLRVAVGVRDLHGPLSSERNFDTELLNWGERAGIEYGLLTNFGQNRVWYFNDPQPLNRPVLEVDIHGYLTDGSAELDALGAEMFAQLVNLGPRAQKTDPISTAQQTTQVFDFSAVQQKITEQIDFPTEFPPPTEDDSPPPAELLPPYGEADGPRRRFDAVLPGIAVQAAALPRRTITALVTDRDSGEPRLLLAGGDIPEGTEFFQPDPTTAGDSIGAVSRGLFDAEFGLAALAPLAGERAFLSTLPNRQPISGVAAPVEKTAVIKFGGGTGCTRAAIGQIGTPVEFTDDAGRDILLKNTFLVAGPDFSGKYDVGAPVLEADTLRLVGVIAGYNKNGTVCLPIQPILNALNVELITEPVRFVRQHTPTDELTAANDLIGGPDRLGFSHYVDAFVRLIRDKDTQPPLTIGIYGAWGTGKSFLMDKIAGAIQDSPGRPSLAAKTVLVKFEAWDYNGSDKLWAGLVEQIFGTLEKELGWYWQLKFNFKRNLEHQWRQLRRRILPYLLISVGLALAVVYLLIDQTVQRAIAAGGIVTFLALLLPQLVKLFSTSASQRVVDMFAAQDYKQDIGFMGRIKSDLKDFAEELPRDSKVIVFIDDLDRCEPRKAVEVLEATKLLLELNRFIVFLAIDARIITQAVEEYYGKVLIEAEITGYEYLDKIVQIPFSIPEPRPADLRNYLGSLMGLSAAEIPPLEQPAPEPRAEFAPEPIPIREGEPDDEQEPDEDDDRHDDDDEPDADDVQISERDDDEADEQPSSAAAPPPVAERAFDTVEVAFTPEEQRAFLDLHPFLDPNPRRLKRLVNIYRLVRVLIGHRQAETGAPAPADDPKHTLAWLVLCEQWPYAAHTMLDEMDERLKATEPGSAERRETLRQTLAELHTAAQARIADEADNEALQKLDLKYERLEMFIERHLQDFTAADLRRLRPFTVNFNPALSAEVRLTLAHH